MWLQPLSGKRGSSLLVLNSRANESYAVEPLATFLLEFTEAAAYAHTNGYDQS